jgi:hypothetical protein
MTPTQAYNAANDGSMSLDELSDEEYNKLHDLYRENCLIDNETAFGNCMDSVPSSTLKDKELRDCVIENFPQEAIYDLLNSVASGGQEKNIEIYMGCAQLKLGVEENLKKDCRNDKGRKTKQCNAIGKTTFFH